MVAVGLGFSIPAHSLLHLLWQVPLLMLLAVLATAGIGALLDVAPTAIRTR